VAQKTLPLIDAAMLERVAKFAATGADPTGHYVHTETLRAVIQGAEKANDEVKKRVLDYLETNLICGAEYVDSIYLGMAIGNLSKEIHDSGFWVIVMDLKNLDKLPIVSIQGESVH
jgi:hypothetical protein